MTFTFHRTGDEDYPAWLKCLIMGLPKSGKTSMVSTFPNLVIADVEAGLMSVAHKNLPYVEVGDSQTLRTLLMILKDEILRSRAANQLGLDVIETVAIDTIDGLQRLLKKERMQSERRDFMKRDDWSWLLEEMRELLGAFIELPMNVVLTVHAKLQVIDDEGTTVPAPLLQGAIADDVPGFVGFSLMTFKQRKIDAKGNSFTEYLVQTEGDDHTPYLGNRAAGRLPKFIEPNFKILHDAVYDNLQLARQVPIVFQREQTAGEQAESEAFQGSEHSRPTPEVKPAPTGVPLDDALEPVHKVALDHLRKAYGEFDLVLPDGVERWTLAKAREVMRWIVSCKSDQEAGDIQVERGETAADALRREVIRGLKGVGAYQDASDERSLPQVMTGTMQDVLAWVGEDQGRAMLALDAEVAGKNRRTLIPELMRLARISELPEGAKSGPRASREPEPAPEPERESKPEPEVLQPVAADEATEHEWHPFDQVMEEEVVARVTTELDATPVAGNGQVVPDEARPCEVCEVTKLMDPQKLDLDIARLSQSRFGSWLCVDDYMARTRQPNRA